MAQRKATVVARPKDRDGNGKFNRVDCGYGNPCGDFSAGISGEVVSKEAREQGPGNRDQKPAIKLICNFMVARNAVY